jgi:hypothetical protein
MLMAELMLDLFRQVPTVSPMPILVACMQELAAEPNLKDSLLHTHMFAQTSENELVWP